MHFIENQNKVKHLIHLSRLYQHWKITMHFQILSIRYWRLIIHRSSIFRKSHSKIIQTTLYESVARLLFTMTSWLQTVPSFKVLPIDDQVYWILTKTIQSFSSSVFFFSSAFITRRQLALSFDREFESMDSTNGSNSTRKQFTIIQWSNRITTYLRLHL